MITPRRGTTTADKTRCIALRLAARPFYNEHRLSAVGGVLRCPAGFVALLPVRRCATPISFRSYPAGKKSTICIDQPVDMFIAKVWYPAM